MKSHRFVPFAWTLLLEFLFCFVVLNPAFAVVSHGHYCGIDNHQYGKPPVSEVDLACLRHDRCYAFPGRHNACVCDQALVQEAKNIIHYCDDVHTYRMLPCGKGYAYLIVAAFSMKPCAQSYVPGTRHQGGWAFPLGRGIFTH